MRLLKFIIGLLLLPLCLAATRSIFIICQGLSSSSFGNNPASFFGLIIGICFWLVLYFSMPRPAWSYVLGHELTHAFWAWLFGAKVSHVKVSSKGGSVNVSHSNFIITLAPYFFPIYTILVLIIYQLVVLFYDQRTYEPLWLGCVGLTWAFHVTFTLSMLKTHQPDIAEHGKLFSFSFIYLMNLLVLGFLIVCIASPTIAALEHQFHHDIRLVLYYSATLFRKAWALAVSNLRGIA